MKNYDELTNDLLERRDRFVTDQKKKRKRVMGVATLLCSFCLVAVIGFGAWQSGVFQKPPMISIPDGSADSSLPNTQMQTGVEPTNPEPSGSPMGVYTTLEVSYDEAKKIFGCPIVECTSSDFLGYKVGIVSQNGNIDSNEAFCYDVTYEFTDGIILIQDQDRSIGKLAGPGIERYNYLGRTFVTENSYDDGHVMIGYYPTDMNGFAYLATFDNSVDVYEIMDLIISVEIN